VRLKETEILEKTERFKKTDSLENTERYLRRQRD